MPRKFCAIAVKGAKDNVLSLTKDFFSKNEGLMAEDSPESIEEALKTSTKSFLMVLKSPKFHPTSDKTHFKVTQIGDWAFLAFEQPGLIPGLVTYLSQEMNTMVLGTDIIEVDEYVHFCNVKSGDLASLYTQFHGDAAEEVNMNYSAILKQYAAKGKPGAAIDKANPKKSAVQVLTQIMPLDLWIEADHLLDGSKDSEEWCYFLQTDRRLELQLGVGSDSWEHLVAAAG